MRFTKHWHFVVDTARVSNSQRQLYPQARLNHRYGSNRSPNPPTWDFLDLKSAGGFSCCFWGRGAGNRASRPDFGPEALLCNIGFVVLDGAVPIGPRIQ